MKALVGLWEKCLGDLGSPLKSVYGEYQEEDLQDRVTRIFRFTWGHHWIQTNLGYEGK
jgi:hypothetical protein